MNSHTQEIMTTALRTEAAKALSDAAYAVRQQNAGIAEVREHVARALAALEMSMPNAAIQNQRVA